MFAVSLVAIRSIVLNGMQRLIIPRRSLKDSSKLINTTTSFGGTTWTSCGLLSTRSTSRFRSTTLDQAFVNPRLIDQVRSVHYAWGMDENAPKRRDALSDHAALILDLQTDEEKQ